MGRLGTYPLSTCNNKKYTKIRQFWAGFCPPLAAVISDSSSEVILVATQRLSSTNVLMGEVVATLLSTRLAAFPSVGQFLLQGDAHLVILVVNQFLIFSS